MNSLQKLQQLSTVSSTSFPTIKQHIRSDRTIDSDHQTHEITEFGQEMLLCFVCDRQILFDEFQQVAESMNFKMIEKQQNYAMAIIQQKKSVFNILNCFSLADSQNITAVKIIVENGRTDSQVLCKLIGLTGCKKLTKRFFTEFYKNTVSFLSQESEKQLNRSKFKSQSFQLQNSSNPFEIENAVMFTVNKFFSDQKSDISKFVSLKISQIRRLISDMNQKQAKQLSKLKPMTFIMSFVDETVKLLQQAIKKSQLKMTSQSVLYLRCAIEKFVFQKINEQLAIFYNKRTSQVSRIFEQKRQLIFDKYTLGQIIQQASISEKFNFLVGQQKERLQKSKFTASELIKVLGYQAPCQQIHKLFLFNSFYPRQSIKFCQEMYAQLKILINQKSNNKVQLSNMEDIIPMTILIVLLCGNHDSQSKKGNLRRDLELMLDFINNDPCDCQAQKRLVVNMIESINYVARDWKL